MVIALRELNRFKPRERPGGADGSRDRRPLSSSPLTADRGLTDEQHAFVEAIRDFAAREQFDRPSERRPLATRCARMGELGWYGLQIPEEYGGSGGTFLDATLFLEEFARGRIPVAATG